MSIGPHAKGYGRAPDHGYVDVMLVHECKLLRAIPVLWPDWAPLRRLITENDESFLSLALWFLVADDVWNVCALPEERGIAGEVDMRVHVYNHALDDGSHCLRSLSAPGLAVSGVGKVLTPSFAMGAL